MSHHVDENGRLNIDLFTISPDYHLLNKEDKMEVLRLIKDWLDIEVIKIQFEDE
jgi:hypothetical protein